VPLLLGLPEVSLKGRARLRIKRWWALGDDLRAFEPQSGQPCLKSGIMAGTGGDGRVCKSLTWGARSDY
jgi:hypothetical protein